MSKPSGTKSITKKKPDVVTNHVVSHLRSNTEQIAFKKGDFSAPFIKSEPELVSDWSIKQRSLISLSSGD